LRFAHEYRVGLQKVHLAQVRRTFADFFQEHFRCQSFIAPFHLCARFGPVVCSLSGVVRSRIGLLRLRSSKPGDPKQNSDKQRAASSRSKLRDRSRTGPGQAPGFVSCTGEENDLAGSCRRSSCQ
jgi:hypothetical protein